MTRGEAWTTHAAAALVGCSGLVYGWMRYFAQPADEFAVVNHPWQATLQGLHILTAPLLVFAAGLLWREHVWRRIQSGYPKRRRTGLFLFLLLVPMIASGYLLQVASEEPWRTTWIWVHGVSSSGWLAVYGIHQLTPKGRKGGRVASPSG